MGASSIAQSVKHLPAMWETWVQFLVWEVPMKKGMATQSSILAWRIPLTGEPGGLQSMEQKELDTAEVTEHIFKAVYIFRKRKLKIHTLNTLLHNLDFDQQN